MRLRLQEHKEHRQDKAHEGGDVVPVEGFSLEHEHYYDGEDREGDNFLNDFELEEVERAAVGLEADAVCRDGEAVLKEGYSPGEQDDQNEWPAGGDFHLTELEMAVPGKSHENVGKYQHQDCPKTLHLHFLSLKTAQI